MKRSISFSALALLAATGIACGGDKQQQPAQTPTANLAAGYNTQPGQPGYQPGQPGYQPGQPGAYQPPPPGGGQPGYQPPPPGGGQPGYPPPQPGAQPPGYPPPQPGGQPPGYPPPPGGQPGAAPPPSGGIPGLPFPIPGMPPMPGAQPAPGGQPAPAGGGAQPLDPTFAVVPLTTVANTEAPGMQKEGNAIAGNFPQGASLELPFSMQPGKCYTFVGVGAGIQQLDASLVVTPVPGFPGLPPQSAQGKATPTGSSVVLGSKTSCIKLAISPVAMSAKIVITATRGAGLGAGQLYSK